MQISLHRCEGIAATKCWPGNGSSLTIQVASKDNEPLELVLYMGHDEDSARRALDAFFALGGDPAEINRKAGSANLSREVIGRIVDAKIEEHWGDYKPAEAEE